MSDLSDVVVDEELAAILETDPEGLIGQVFDQETERMKWDVWAQEGTPGEPGPQGETGPQGPTGPAGLTWRGAWDSGTAYSVDDAVGRHGASWFAPTAISAGNDPNTSGDGSTATNGWALLASQGATGAQGAQGIQGPQGTAGATGATGPTGPSDLMAAFIQNRPRTYGSVVPRGDGLFSICVVGILTGGATSIAGTNVYFSDTHGNAYEWGTGAVSGQAAHWSTASGQIQLQYKPATIFEFGVDSVATGRFFCGFGGPASPINMLDSDDVHAADSPYVGITYSKGTRNDTNFQFVVCKDNTAQTLIDTGVALGVGPWFVSVDGSDGTTVTVKLYDSTFTQVATHTFLAATLPSVSTSMRDVIGIEATNATDRRIRIYQIHKVMQP